MFKLPSVVHFFTYLTIMTTALSQPGAFIYNAESGDTLDNWLVINDGVMGGMSRSTLGQDDEGHLHFSGRVSLENNGGFCSVRHTFGPIALSDKASIVLRIKGDGKRYQFRIKGDSNTYYNYITYFETSGKWETITLRLDTFTANFRGRALNMPNFDSDQLAKVGILIGNKQAEAFELKVASIQLD